MGLPGCPAPSSLETRRYSADGSDSLGDTRRVDGVLPTVTPRDAWSFKQTDARDSGIGRHRHGGHVRTCGSGASIMTGRNGCSLLKGPALKP